MTKFAASVAIFVGAFAAGCINVEQTLTLERSMAGRAGFAMNFDLEPVVGFMAAAQRSMAGKSGPPTAAELAEARKEFLSSGRASTSAEFEKGRTDFERGLPAGVTLLDASFKDDGLKFAATMLFGFDNVAKLSQITFPETDGIKPPGPSTSSAVDAPFGGLQLVDDGKTLLLSTPARNPMGDQQAELGQPGQAPMDAAMKAMAEGLFAGMRVSFRITAPFEVIEHNAHRREGSTLVWDYNFQTLAKLTPAQAKQGMFVRYRK
jgi:hypothetical protein